MKVCVTRAIVLWAILIGMPLTGVGESPPQRPNILFIMTDQQPVQGVGAYGNPLVKTPNIDRLAREGMRFDGMHVAAYPCTPSRACFWTGQYSHHNGVIDNGMMLTEDVPSLGTLFRAAGYQTAWVGKWHLGGQDQHRGESDKHSFELIPDIDYFGFRRSPRWQGGDDKAQCGFADKWVGGWVHYHEYLKRVGLERFLTEERLPGLHTIAPSGQEGTHIYSRVPEEHHVEAFLAKEAVKFIREERNREQPFCLVLSFYGPHLPVAPPQPWDSMVDANDIPLPANHEDTLDGKPPNQRSAHKLSEWSKHQFRDYIARYWGFCSYIDKQIGSVLSALDEEGLASNTIVVFASDHGDFVGTHGCIWKSDSLYDELVRVPFIMRFPPQVKPGTSNAALVSSIDVLPTLLGLCGLNTPEAVDGRSLRELLEGKTEQFRDQVVCHNDRMIMLRDRDWKLVLYRMSPDKPIDLELYDMHQMPLEIHNRANDPKAAEALARMCRLLISWLEETDHPHMEPIKRGLAARIGSDT